MSPGWYRLIPKKSVYGKAIELTLIQRSIVPYSGYRNRRLSKLPDLGEDLNVCNGFLENWPVAEHIYMCCSFQEHVSLR